MKTTGKMITNITEGQQGSAFSLHNYFFDHQIRLFLIALLICFSVDGIACVY